MSLREQDKQILVRYRLEQAHTTLHEARVLQHENPVTMGIANRTYYAMLYALMALHQAYERQFSKHIGAISAFDKDFVHTGIFDKAVSATLHRAFEARQDADYKIIEPLTQDQLQELIHNAQIFIQTVESHLQSTFFTA